MTSRRALLGAAAGIATTGLGTGAIGTVGIGTVGIGTVGIGTVGPHGKANAAPRARLALRPPSDWADLYEQAWSGWSTTYTTWSQGTDSTYHYNVAYAVDAAVQVAEAIGSRDVLLRAIGLVTNLMASAVPSHDLPGSQFSDNYLGWASQRPDVLDKEVPLFESYCWRYVARLLRVVRQNPTWYADTEIRAHYDLILAFTEVHIAEKWIVRSPATPLPGEQTSIFRNRTHLAAHWAFICLDLSLVTASPTNAATYQSIVDSIDTDMPNFPSSLRGQMVPHAADSTAYFWDWIWGGTSSQGSDVSHGSNVVAYLVEAEEHGSEWALADLDKLVRTFDTILWPSEFVHAGWLDGTVTTDQSITRCNDGWSKLGRHSEALQIRLEGGHSTSALGMYACQFYANGAYNALKLGA